MQNAFQGILLTKRSAANGLIQSPQCIRYKVAFLGRIMNQLAPTLDFRRYQSIHPQNEAHKLQFG